MEIKVPSVGESVVEALVGKWLKKSGEQVAKDDVVCELETDKITFTLQADASGVLQQLVPEGETVKIGTVIGEIEENGLTAPALATAAASPGQPPPSSPSARKLAAEKGIDLATVTGSGKSGGITAEDIDKAGLGAKVQARKSQA